MDRKKQALVIIDLLKEEYPEDICSLEYQKDYELLFATRLAAQCTDERVNKVTKVLYKVYPTLKSLAEADINDLENYVRSTGFFRVKARDIKATAQILIDRFDGRVPDTMEQLLTLPGVGRKTANLILGDIYGKPAIVCDTHCIRITNLLGLSTSKDPTKVEFQLKEILPPDESNDFCHRLVLHGRAVCVARRPKCDICVLRDHCDYYNSQNSE
ncbi:MAG: endonuclease III [Eubacteriales bacterium]